jgi:hypothetical protein
MKTADSSLEEYPFAKQFITDRRGHISKVVLSFRDYRALIEALEDAGLYRAMKQVAKEKPLNAPVALALLHKK